MAEVTRDYQDDQMIIELHGKIDSGNAARVEEQIRGLLEEAPSERLLIEAKELSYISSAGLRVLLRLRKGHRDMTIRNVRPEVYEILDMTGFTQMMTVEKAYREVSIEGCEEIGRGANGTVYRIDGDNVVKVYNDPDALDEIRNEQEVARLALILGIPTAISYEVVRVGDTYGSVFEMLDARSFSSILAKEPEKMDWCVKEYVRLLKRIHATQVPEGKLPDMRKRAFHYVEEARGYLSDEICDRLRSMIEEIPESDHMLHGDYHTKNIQLTDDEVMLIDMDTLSTGDPIFELAFMYNAYIGFGEYDPDRVRSFIGFDNELAAEFWRKSLAAYLETEDEAQIESVERKARIIGYLRMIRRALRLHHQETEKGAAEIALWTERLLALMETTSSLRIDSNELYIVAETDNLPRVIDFVESRLRRIECPLKAEMEITMAVEEIFVNIASYAYFPEKGGTTVRIDVQDDPVTVTITFIDQGKPYDPLAHEEPDVTLSAEERSIGGLGIFLVRKAMDDVTYEYRDGQNILTLKKTM